MQPNTRAILYLQLCLLSFLIGDSLAKKPLATLPLGQVMCLRTLVSLVVLTAMVIITGRLALLKTRRPVHHFLRSLFFALISLGYYVAVKYFPMSAVAAALAGAPIIISAISPLLLREHANSIQWIATITGFVGVSLALKPDLSSISWNYLALLTLPVSYAGMILWSRYLSRTESDWSLNFYFYFPLLVLAWFWPAEWVPLTAMELLLIFISGSGCAAGFILMVAAFRIGKPVVVAPFEYTSIIMAAGVDMLFWQFFPDYVMWVGISLILLCAVIQAWQARIEPPAITPHLRAEDTHRP